MAPDQHRPRKTASHKHINCFSFKSCFGLPHGSKMAKKNDQTLVKYGKGRSSGWTRTRAVPAVTHNHQTYGTPFTSEEEAVEGSDLPPHYHQVNSNKVHDTLKNSKRLHEMSRAMGSIKYEESSRTQETWSNRGKMLRSVSQLKEDKSIEKFAKGDQLIVSDQLSPMVGALIMTVILIVMLVCGKLCAIICTATWFYTVPLIRASNNALDVDELKVGSEDIVVDSPESKKGVVLEGLLRRDYNV